MKKYVSILKCGFIEGCAYRSNIFTSMTANFIQTIVLYYVWKSIFQYQNIINGMTWDVMKRYVFVSFFCNSIFSFGFELQTASKIIKGDIILDLIKPITYQKMQHFRLLGNAIMEFLFTVIIVGTSYFLFNGWKSMTIYQLSFFSLSFICGQEIKALLQYIFSISCYYTDNAYGVVKAREILTNFFSGAIIPINMFPTGLKFFVSILPFQSIVYSPCKIFLGLYSIKNCLKVLLIQVVWILILKIVSKKIWEIAINNISLYGG